MELKVVISNPNGKIYEDLVITLGENWHPTAAAGYIIGEVRNWARDRGFSVEEIRHGRNKNRVGRSGLESRTRV